MNATMLPAIQSRIFAMRGHRVLIDADLARLYGVETRVLVQAVKRNRKRFPKDFMFQLTKAETQSLDDLTSQSVISSSGHGGRRGAPYAFTEQGVAMLSSVLRSTQAVAVNIQIMRTFVRLRELTATHAGLARRLSNLERATIEIAQRHDATEADLRAQLEKVFGTIKAMTAPTGSGRPIGYVAPQVRKGPKAR